jgi:hypothetical protein
VILQIIARQRDGFPNEIVDVQLNSGPGIVAEIRPDAFGGSML